VPSPSHIWLGSHPEPGGSSVGKLLQKSPGSLGSEYTHLPALGPRSMHCATFQHCLTGHLFGSPPEQTPLRQRVGLPKVEAWQGLSHLSPSVSGRGSRTQVPVAAVARSQCSSRELAVPWLVARCCLLPNIRRLGLHVGRYTSAVARRVDMSRQQPHSSCKQQDA
jgi:hypothetical protein